MRAATSEMRTAPRKVPHLKKGALVTRRSFYRIASVLLLVFAMAQTIGFRQVDPAWGVGDVVARMQSTHFNLLGSDRTYWQILTGYGFLFSVLLVFAAALAWQLGNLSDQAFEDMRGIALTLVVLFGAVTVLCLRYTFIVPTGFSVAITLCLAAAVWGSAARALHRRAC